jgi:hypothetical protein
MIRLLISHVLYWLAISTDPWLNILRHSMQILATSINWRKVCARSLPSINKSFTLIQLPEWRVTSEFNVHLVSNFSYLSLSPPTLKFSNQIETTSTSILPLLSHVTWIYYISIILIVHAFWFHMKLNLLQIISWLNAID